MLAVDEYIKTYEEGTYHFLSALFSPHSICSGQTALFPIQSFAVNVQYQLANAVVYEIMSSMTKGVPLLFSGRSVITHSLSSIHSPAAGESATTKKVLQGPGIEIASLNLC
jgi:hypothetical protein